MENGHNIQFAKSGNAWGTNELEAFNISIVEEEQHKFFDGPLSPYSGPSGFLKHEDRVEGLDSASLALIKRLHLAKEIVAGEASAVTDFVVELLRSGGYETEETVVCTRKCIRLLMCGEQEDKNHIKLQEPEPQLVAQAIAAFQANNRRVKDFLFEEPLEEMDIHGILMSGTFPRFYKIKVTAELDRCVRHGTYPPMQTIVYRHTPRVLNRWSDGMRPLDNRGHILRCFQAFKQLSFDQIYS